MEKVYLPAGYLSVSVILIVYEVLFMLPLRTVLPSLSVMANLEPVNVPITSLRLPNAYLMVEKSLM